jgi:hypothetical protein
MIEDWKRWIHKKVVVELKSNSKYFGTVSEVIADTSDEGIIWIGMHRRDNGKFVLFSSKEILKIEEIE